MRYLRQSTAATVAVGPFLAIADGVTAVTALAAQAGRVVKNGTGAALSAPAAWAHDGNGYYLVGFLAGDTDTVGRLRVQFTDAATYLPVWEDFSVLSAAVYDVLFGTAALSTGTAPTAAAIAVAVEDAIMNEADSRAVLQAIVDKINAADPDLAGLTLSAIAQAVRDVSNAAPAANSLGAGIAAIKAKADTLPNDPADASDVATALAALQTHGDSAWATATSVTVSDKAGFKLAADGTNLVLVDGKTLPAALQIIGAGAGGNVTGAGTGVEIFIGLDGATPRITFTVDSQGNRTAVYG